MKRLLFALALVGITAPAFADVGVSINVGEPGFYGRIDIGSVTQPRLIYRQPVVVERVVTVREPLYLRVPPGHAKNWKKHCREYDACGRKVYFVDNRWYNDVYVPRYREIREREHREHDGHRDDHDQRDRHDDHEHRDDRDDHGHHDRDDDHDRDHDHGKHHK